MMMRLQGGDARMTPRWPTRLAIVAMSVIATAAVAFAIANLIPEETLLARDIRHASPVASVQFHHEASNLPGPIVVGGNRVTVLQNGAESFPAMLAAIRSARQSVDFESYIYWSGEVGREFVQALAERARAGVPVHVLLDGIGGHKISEESERELRASGAQLKFFHPVHWWTLDRLNNRDHRKILVVDGRVGFTGGIGIADEWSGNATRTDHWRDMQFQVQGPVVSQMQAVFEDNWITVTGNVLLGPGYFPALPAQGSADAQMFSSSPDSGSENMQLMYLMSIAAARKSIDLEAAYFLPGDLVQKALQAALKRGVKLRVIVPGEHIDSQLVMSASQEKWGVVLANGGHIYRFQPAMFHNKMMIVDGHLTMIGSANFDERSFKLNDEANLNVYDAGFAAHMTQVFDQDVARSREVTYSQWQHRSWWSKLKDKFSSLTASQL
jgi:cardiolipin synthase A/B